jgi:uncharacterized alkaline shock family protein YloU
MTDTTTTSSAPTTMPGSGASVPASSGVRGASLVTDHGRTSIADSVVAKIAGIAAREMHGVHEMGSGAARAVGAIREKISSSGRSGVTQGVSVEVGERQAAIDLDLVVEYGVSILDLSDGVRRNVISRVESMTGLEVTEVNITVDDIYLGDDEPSSDEEPRVR